MLILLKLGLPQSANTEIIDKILAKVGGTVITQYDVDMYAPALIRELNALPSADKGKRLQEHNSAVLEIMIESALLESAAAGLGVTVTPAEVDDVILRAAEQNLAFKERVDAIRERERRVTPEIRIFVKTTILEQKMTAYLANKAVVSKGDLYSALKEEGNLGLGQQEYLIQILFLPDKSSYDIFATASGSFEERAAAATLSPVDLGWVTKNYIIPELAESAVTMKTGDVSSPVVDEEGRYLVIKLGGVREKTAVSPEAETAATERLKLKRMEEIYLNWLAENRKTILIYRAK